MEVLILDQTEEHEPSTIEALAELHSERTIRWVRLAEPSIPAAMNRGLLEASAPVVLFLDDDIRPEAELLEAHLAAHLVHSDALIAGRVIQPWQEGQDFTQDREFHFACTTGQEVSEFMGGNFSVRRTTALALGGFDENFVRVAYRFEAEFAHRFRASGRSIWFEPAACLHHLKEASGGTRTFGDFLRTVRPDHAVGAYYYALRTLNGSALLRALVVRPVKSVMTRHHLKRPWWIPLTLVGELRALAWALMLYSRGPRYAAQGAAIRDDVHI
jgi:GT2 family glycosyltransferase